MKNYFMFFRPRPEADPLSNALADFSAVLGAPLARLGTTLCLAYDSESVFTKMASTLDPSPQAFVDWLPPDTVASGWPER